VRVLDLFCCAGGAARGFQQAGFYAVGVDINPQPNYCGDEFIQMDALGWVDLDGFDLIHASPPCQHFTRYRNAVKDIAERYEDLIEPTRALLQASGKPYVIENVPNAPLREDLMLCGSMFGLDVRRHRVFEIGGFTVPQPVCNHKVNVRRKYKSSSTRKNKRFTIEVGAWDEPLEAQKLAMGVDWDLTVRELSEAIPPRFTRFIGDAFLQGLEDS
jgi:DNA (cytosine-5)-methyltransferase 1